MENGKPASPAGVISPKKGGGPTTIPEIEIANLVLLLCCLWSLSSPRILEQ